MKVIKISGSEVWSMHLVIRIHTFFKPEKIKPNFQFNPRKMEINFQNSRIENSFKLLSKRRLPGELIFFLFQRTENQIWKEEFFALNQF